MYAAGLSSHEREWVRWFSFQKTVAALRKCENICRKHFEYSSSLGIGGTCGENILWRVQDRRYYHLWSFALREKCLNTEFFLVCIFPHSDWIQKKTRIWTLFTQCSCSPFINKFPFDWLTNQFNWQGQFPLSKYKKTLVMICGRVCIHTWKLWIYQFFSKSSIKSLIVSLMYL